mmetsp:Transcript_985/g.2022  ORF Transcript_985/g.2022 Transcript_985/m.2022 type:complete len:450 (-) Transcript_985:338-1687(-)
MSLFRWCLSCFPHSKLEQCKSRLEDPILLKRGEDIFQAGVEYERAREFECAKYCYEQAGLQLRHPWALTNLAYLMVSGDCSCSNDHNVGKLFETAAEIRWNDVSTFFGIEPADVEPLDFQDVIPCDTDLCGQDRYRDFARDCSLLRNPATPEETKTFKALCHLAVLLMEPRNPKYNLMASLFLLHRGYKEHIAEAAFWLGRSLTLGTGCPVRNRFGKLLVEAAASRQVPRALLEMGLKFENGYRESHEMRFEPNPPFARELYDAAARAAQSDRQPLIDECEICLLQRNDQWNTLQDCLVDTFSKTLAWELAGQAFLFNAAAVLTTTTDKVRYYPILLVVIPMIGVLISVLSLLSSGMVLSVHTKRRWQVLREMYQAKFEACRAIVGNRRAFQPPGPSHDVVAFMARVADEVSLLLSLSYLLAWILVMLNFVLGNDCSVNVFSCGDHRPE